MERRKLRVGVTEERRHERALIDFSTVQPDCRISTSLMGHGASGVSIHLLTCAQTAFRRRQGWCMSDVTEIHVVCKRAGPNGEPLNVRDLTSSHFVSGKWVIAKKHLQPGVLFALHKSRADKSFMQGTIEDIESVNGSRVEVLVRRTAQSVEWEGNGTGEKGYKHDSGNLPIPQAAQGFIPPDISDEELRKLVSRLVQLREGQPAFRRQLLAAYGRKCAVTSCAIEELLQAAHILPYGRHGKSSNHVQNGLLLRADIHNLFDRQLLEFRPTIDGIRIATSNDLRGTEYEKFDGKYLRLPTRDAHRPSRAALNKRIYCLPKL